MKQWIVAVALGALAACGGGSTAPTPRFDITLPTGLSVTAFRTQINGAQTYICNFPITVKGASGSQTDYAIWLNGSLDIALLAGGPPGHLTLSSYDLVGVFGADRVYPNETKTGSYSYQWSGPSSGTLRLNYMVFGSTEFAGEHAATINISCT